MFRTSEDGDFITPIIQEPDNNQGDPKKELHKRMAATYLTWKKLEEFWKHGNSEIRENLKEICSSEQYLQLSFKYFPKSCFLKKTFANSSDHPATLMCEWVNAYTVKPHDSV